MDYGYPNLNSKEILDTAKSVVGRINSGGADEIVLHSLSSENLRELRRAFDILAREGTDYGLAFTAEILRYAPALTGRVLSYMVSAYRNGEDVGPAWESAVHYSSEFNVWQNSWLAYAARECELSSAVTETWLRSQFDAADPGLLHAECALTLARLGKMNFSDLDTFIRTQPESLSAWYAIAMNYLDSSSDKKVNATRSSSALFGLLIEQRK